MPFDKPIIVVIILSVSFLYGIYLYDDNNKQITHTGVVLITGTSSGIGKDAAFYLAEKGFVVFSAVRKQQDVESLKKEAVEHKLDKNLIPVLMDVTNVAQINATRDQIQQYVKQNKIDFIGVVNNAGTMFAKPVEYTSLDSLRQLFEVNYIGAYSTIQQFLPLLKQAKKGTGRIINISSVSGRISPPLLSSYSASKYAMESLCDCLRTELSDFGIKTICLEPGYVKTPFSDNSKSNNLAQRNAEHEKEYPLLKKFYEVQNKDKGIHAVVVSQEIHRVLTARNPPARYIVGDEATPMFFITKMPQLVIDWILLKFSYE